MSSVSLMEGPRDRSDDITSEPTPLVVEVRGPLAPGEAARLRDRVQRRLRAECPRGVICDVRGTADLGVIDVLAGLLLVVREQGCWLRIRAMNHDLAALLALTGLDEALGPRLEPRRQAESGKQRGVEEVVHMPDPSG